MNEYTVYDFEESLLDAHVDKNNVAAVLYGWGESPEGYGSWSGGFVVQLNDGQYAKIEGWCDTSGWGCQDGADVEYSATLPQVPQAADANPVDLNNSLSKPDRFGPRV